MLVYMIAAHKLSNTWKFLYIAPLNLIFMTEYSSGCIFYLNIQVFVLLCLRLPTSQTNRVLFFSHVAA